MHSFVLKLLLGLLEELLGGLQLLGEEGQLLPECEVVVLVGGDEGLCDLGGLLLHQALPLEVPYVLLARSVDVGLNRCR